jgi:hypothetical protein
MVALIPVSSAARDTRAAGASLIAGMVVTVLAAQALPADDDVASSLRALGHGMVGTWLALLALTLVDVLLRIGRRRGERLAFPAWRLATLVTGCIVPRFRDDLTAAPVAAFWLVLLLVCGAAITQEVAGRRALRPYWIAASLLVAPWGLLHGVPAWP